MGCSTLTWGCPDVSNEAIAIARWLFFYLNRLGLTKAKREPSHRNGGFRASRKDICF